MKGKSQNVCDLKIKTDFDMSYITLRVKAFVPPQSKLNDSTIHHEQHPIFHHSNDYPLLLKEATMLEHHARLALQENLIPETQKYNLP